MGPILLMVYKVLRKSILLLIAFIMVQSGHNFTHVTTAQLLYHVKNYDLIWSIFSMVYVHVLL